MAPNRMEWNRRIPTNPCDLRCYKEEGCWCKELVMVQSPPQPRFEESCSSLPTFPPRDEVFSIVQCMSVCLYFLRSNPLTSITANVGCRPCRGRHARWLVFLGKQTHRGCGMPAQISSSSSPITELVALQLSASLGVVAPIRQEDSISLTTTASLADRTAIHDRITERRH